MVNKLPGYPQPISGFNLSHSFDYTANMGNAVPVLCLEYCPGDIFSIKWDDLIRMTPLQAPTMSDINIRFDVFRVDMNIIWPEFLDFIKQIGSEENPISAPYMTVPSGGFAESSLADYLGVVPGTGVGTKISALPFRAYTKCVNDYYLNSNVDEELPLSTASGEDLITNTTLQKIRWSRNGDRFTSAMPEPQRGDDVVLPVGSTANVDVYGNGKALGLKYNGTSGVDYLSRTTVLNNNSSGVLGLATAVDATLPIGSGSVQGSNVSGFSAGTLFGVSQDKTLSGLTGSLNLDESAGVSLRAFRLANKLQQFRELSMMAGDRYVEWQKAFFAVPSSDARLQRSEWLGGFKQPMIVSEVLQNSETNETPQGTMAGHGFSVGQGGVNVRLNEYGFIVIIASVMPKANYQQGLPKMFSRFSNFDYMNPMFSHLSFQEIKEREIFWQNASVKVNEVEQNETPFAFEPIFNEYRYAMNRVSGSFRSSLKQWLLTRIFDSAPNFNTQFIEGNPSSRIFAVESDNVDKLYCSIRFNIKAIRHLPKVGMPSL